ncbi:MAG: zinc-ribbon domain-containing protein [Clostridia bacterium]|nr:zinc-ribbon domain-containing protein [Clostridia bacterium]
MTNNYTVSPGFDCTALSLALLDFLENTKQLTAQHIMVSDTEWIVQAREKSSLKKIMGMDKATTVKLNINNTHLTIEIGQGKWLDKIAANAIGYWLFWPALIPGAIGAYQQMQLPKEISRFIASYINKSSYNLVYSEQTSKKFCPNCGTKIVPGSIFCEECGQKID